VCSRYSEVVEYLDLPSFTHQTTMPRFLVSYSRPYLARSFKMMFWRCSGSLWLPELLESRLCNILVLMSVCIRHISHRGLKTLMLLPQTLALILVLEGPRDLFQPLRGFTAGRWPRYYVVHAFRIDKGRWIIER